MKKILMSLKIGNVFNKLVTSNVSNNNRNGYRNIVMVTGLVIKN